MIVKEANNVDYVSQLSSEAKSVISDIRRACEELGSLIKSHPEILNYTDAKLHQIAFNADEDDYRKYFEWFCEDEWMVFKDYLTEHNLTTKGVRSSNSKFYIRSTEDNIINSFLDEHSSRHERNSFDSRSALSVGVDLAYEWFNEGSIFDVDILNSVETDKELNEFIDYYLDEPHYTDGYHYTNEEPYTMSDIETMIIEQAEVVDVVGEVTGYIIPIIENIIDGYNYIIQRRNDEMDIWNDFVDFAKEQEADMDIEF